MATPTSTLAGKLLLSVEETAILLGQTRSTLYRAIHAETLPLPVHLVGRRMKIPRAAVSTASSPGWAPPRRLRRP